MTVPANIMSLPIQDTSSQIVVIGHDTNSLDYLSYLLGRYHKVRTCCKWTDALACGEEGTVDVVLLDIDDYDLARNTQLKHWLSELQRCNVAVILMGSVSAPHTIAELLQSGASDYMIKPVEAPIILARVNTQLKMKRLVDERQAAIQAMQQSETIRKQFSRIASHDLKNPLHNMRLAEHLLRAEVGSNPRVRSVLDMIDLTVETMQRVIEDFVDMARLHGDDIAFNMEPLALYDVVANVLVQYELAAAEKQISLSVETVEGYVVADHARIIQSFSNLISNAIKYSPHGSTVRIWSELEADSWRLCVGDEGPGIPVQERPRLFEEFGKLSTRPTGGEPSTGLGLWIVKHLMTKQGGNVGAHFPAEGGSVFWIALPVYEAEAEGIA